jgi:hypothetical protein
MIGQLAQALDRAPKGARVTVACQGAASRTAEKALAAIALRWTLEGVAWNHEHHGRLARLAFRTPA